MDNTQLMQMIQQMSASQPSAPNTAAYEDTPDQARKARMFAQYAILTGDPALSQFGRASMTDQGQRDASRQRNEQNSYQRGQDAIQTNLALARLSQSGQEQDLNRSDRRDALIQRLAEMRDNRDARAQDRQDRNDQQNDNRINQNTQKLSHTLDQGGYAGLQQSTRDVGDMLDRYGNKPIPGIGGVQNIDRFNIGTGTTYLPGGGGEEARQNQATAAALKNEILKARSGSPVTANEADRMLNELQQGLLSGSDDYQKAARRTINTLQARIANVFAGYAPEVIQRYQDQGGTVQMPAAVGGHGATGQWDSNYINSNPRGLSHNEWLESDDPNAAVGARKAPEKWVIGPDGKAKRAQ